MYNQISTKESMRCKKHLPDLTSTLGVCASCLRERLEPLAEAQAQSPHPATGKSDPNHPPPPLNLPPSVSPYVTRRKSDRDRRQERLFHSVPEVGQGFSPACDGGAAAAASKKRIGRFWILSSLFRPRSNKTTEEEDSSRDSYEPSSSASPPLSSWFSTILPARRQNDQRSCRRQSDRGLSPVETVTVTQTESPKIDGRDRSPPGCSSESSPQRRHQTPTVARRSRFCPAGKSLTNIAFCLSPLVRASPNRRWGHKGLAQELSGGLGGPQHISTAVSYCANRSRKLADFGRVAHNR